MPDERPGRQGLRKKIVTSILIIGILPLTLGIFLTYLSGMKLITNTIGTKFEVIAKETADNIALILTKELNISWNLTQMPDIINAVERSNLSFTTNASRASEIHDNDVSRYLRSLYDYKRDYKAILVTNEKGILVASTDLGFDSYQGDKRWWQAAFNKGVGSIYISDVYYDDSEESFLIEIAFPILKIGAEVKKALGAVKIVYKADQIFDVIAGVRIDNTGHANLVSADGVIIICPLYPPKSHFIRGDLISRITTEKTGWSIAEDDGHGGKRSIVGFAPVRFADQLDIDSIVGKRWYVFIRQNPSEAYTPIYKLLVKSFLSGSLLIGIFTLIGFYSARKIIDPIILLKEEAELIGKGDLDHRVHIKTKDEIESLADEFNKMAEKLKESITQSKKEKEKFERILLSAGEGIVVADAENRVIIVNPIAEKILGVSAEEVKGKSIFPCHKYPDSVAQLLMKEDGLPISITTQMGSRTVEVNVAAIRSDASLLGSVMIMKDISLLKQMEEELRQYSEKLERMIDERTREIKKTKEYLENLLENANDVIFTVDRESRFTYINHQIEEWGYRKERLIRKPFYSIFLGEDDKQISQNIQNGIRKIYEVKINTEDGDVRDVVVSTSPIKDDDGIIAGFIGIARDITERKRMQDQMIRTEKMTSIGQLAMGVAHEINNPLSGMLNCIRTLTTETEDRSLNKKYLALIEKGLNRIENIVRQLLGFAKEYSFEFSLHSLDDLILETIELLKYNAESRSIRLETHLNCSKKKYLLPGNHIQQVILNIAMNAIQAMPDGGALTIRSGENKSNLIFVITDTGVGIPRENLMRIFDPFFTTKDVGVGTGLGLSLSYAIIEKLNGQIEVFSEVGKGSTFKVTLPR